MHRQAVILSGFTAGLLLGGLLSATVLWLASGLFSPAPEPWRHAAIVVAALLCVLRDAGALRFALPQNARQIPQGVLQRHLLRGTLQFGFELGTGVRTYLSASAPYAVAVAVLLHGGVWAALLAGAGFGAGRAVTPVLRLLSGDVESWDRRLDSRLAWLRTGTSAVVALSFAAAFALTALG